MLPRGPQHTPVDPLARGDWPSEFDAAAYVRHPWNGDLRDLAAQAVGLHYEAHGRREGRACSAVCNREDFAGLIPAGASILEIGPFCFPTFQKGRHNVRFIDVFTADELRETARRTEGGAPERVPEIDYIWRGERLPDLVPERFDVVFSSHNIEHQTCLISHLNDLANLLTPGGAAFLVVPDKRYCFDHFLPETPLSDVLGAWMQPTYRHRSVDVMKQAFFTTHNDILRHWAGDHGENPFERPITPQMGPAVEGWRTRFANDPSYIDVHAWQFTPDHFRRLVDGLHTMGVSPLKPARVYPTVYGTSEFFAILGAG